MKKILIAGCFVLLSSVVGQAQETENSIFWKIEGNGLEKPSYLFGTIHFMRSEDFFITKSMKEKFKEVDLFSTETLYNHHTTHVLNKAAHLSEDQSLEVLLGKDNYEKLEKLFRERLGVSKLKFGLVYSRLKPVILLSSITQLQLGKDIKYFENELLDLAKKSDLEYLGLETIEREIEALEKYPMDAQVKALIAAVNNFEGHIEDYNGLIKAYKNQDLAQVLFKTLEPENQNSVFKKAFYDERNEEWIPVMKRKMELAPTFFAVGAAHLEGARGLVSLLKSEGYKLTPIEVFN
ncbi:MAG: TraB/GumN family protein [Bacteroidota bacterium]